MTGFVSLDDPVFQNNSKIEQAILNAFEDDNRIEVIIMLKDSERGIRQIQNDVIDSISDLDLGIEYQYENINAISGKLDLDTLANLSSNADVEKIYLNKIYNVNLDESLPLINANDVHTSKKSNTNLKGAYQSVCIIDTGVNYNHPALGGCFGGGCKVIGGHDFVNNDSNPIDDNTHGTHVAGIIASNDSTYKGVAPEANIVAIKACDDGGNCDQSDVIAGIDWCISNKTIFNISVISMSIGDDGQYTSVNCPTDFDTSINNAIANGILVTVSSGNNYYNNGISSPSCSPNATSVGATNDSDVIWSRSNTGSLLDLLAPGVSITSSTGSSDFTLKTGTSMANAHVAGAALLIYQHANLSNEAITPENVRNRLKDNGFNRTDSDSGLNFSRIDLTKTILGSELNISYSIDPYPKTNAEIYFYANYTNRTSDIEISDGSCIVTFNDTSSNMDYNSTKKVYQYFRNFTDAATYSYNMTCNQSSYETLFESSYIEVVKGSENCSYPGSNIDWELTGDNFSRCIGENLIINQSNINIQGNGNFVLKDTNITLIGASSHYVINISSNANFTAINSFITGMDQSSRRLDIDLYGYGDIINTTFKNSRLIINGNKKHLINNSGHCYSRPG